MKKSGNYQIRSRVITNHHYCYECLNFGYDVFGGGTCCSDSYAYQYDTACKAFKSKQVEDKTDDKPKTMEKLKLIFLDIDGVLTLQPTFTIDDRKIKNLEKIVNSTGAKIVLSSSWRVGNPPTVRRTIDFRIKTGQLNQENQHQKWLIDNLFDCTPRQNNGHRGEEIDKYRELTPT